MAAQLSARAVDIVAHFAAAGNGDMPAFQLLHKALDGRLVRAAQRLFFHRVQGNDVYMALHAAQTLRQLCRGRIAGAATGFGYDALSRLGAIVHNLDGGGSTAMVFDGSLVNNPLGRGTERGTSDILYVRR